MLTIHWDLKEGWHAPRIHPYEKLVLDPSASVFHYGMECFEGMKAYKDREGKLRLFRPEMNINRFFQSAQRLSLPTFDKKELLNCIKELVKLESKWVPMEKGYSLYIRPTLIGTQPTLGVGPSGQAQLFVITSPVGPYFPTGFKAVTLLAEEKYVRAWPGGTGANKVGANYAPTILPQLHANALGYQQLLWLFGESHDITEIGTMNCFVYWTNKDGIKELVTPALDGTILPGVTRDSILKLTKQWNEFRVTERKISIHEVIEACQENRLHEMFGAGTACIVCPIKGFVYSDKNFDVPLDPEDPSKEAGPLARRLNQTILSIQYGETPNPWSVVL
ncbi:branched-chain-amino-acid aminotransferase [Coelomomyces lativittatus]|nr:branched-chain-amino-acid aminotransferase [Coelomomyces lativittatus]